MTDNGLQFMYLTDTAIQAHCIKAALSIIKWACRKTIRNYKTLNRKKVTCLEVPWTQCCSTVLTHLFY